LFVDELGRQVLRRLDGAHDRAALLDELAALMQKGEMTVEKDGQPLPEGQSSDELLPQALELQLQTVARSALLMPQ
jgi:hypothetical protein